MRDQATELRNLVLRSARQRAAHSGPPPRLVVVSGGRAGVGATTLAINLSVALSELGSRVVLADVDPDSPAVAARCGLAPANAREPLSARRDIHEILTLGPAGVQIAPGPWQEGPLPGSRESAPQRLLRQFQSLGRHADLILLDVGCRVSDATRRFWHAADDVVLVTTPDAAALMDSYAAIKSQLTADARAHLHLIVNRVADEQLGRDVFGRLDKSCRRFLDCSLGLLGLVPADEALVEAQQAAQPLLVTAVDSPAVAPIRHLANALSDGEPPAARFAA